MPDGDPWAPEHDRVLIVGHGRQVRLAVLSARLRGPHPQLVQRALVGLLTEAAQWCDRVISLERGPYG